MSRQPSSRVHKFFCIVGLATLLCGCASVPEKDVSVPPLRAREFEESVQTAQAGAAFRTDDWPAEEWWRSFHDEQLNRLVAEALAHNPSMQVAAARVRAAQEAAAYARSATQPTLDLNGSVTRRRFSQHELVPASFAGTTINQGRATLDFSYDFDLWDRNRHILQARLSEAQATLADQAESRLILSTAVAQAYFRLQNDQARLKLARDALAWREEELALARSLSDKGLESLRMVEQARAELEQTQQTTVGLEQQTRLDKTALANLTGKGPDAAAEIAAPPAVRLDKAFPVPRNLTLDLLGRRPDVVALRWRVETAAQEAGAAKTRFYPNLNLAALIGLQSIPLAHWLTAESAIASLGPAIYLPLFDGGARVANLNTRYAEYDIAVAQYNQAILDATREIVDRLGNLQSIQQKWLLQEKVLAAKQEIFQFAQSRYRHGLSDYTKVLRAGQEVLEQRNSEIELEESRLQATLALIKALGGGYRMLSSEDKS